ncbi:MAG: M6 family metalloprotease domain-containing protein [Balneolaceae bacterium]|nr:MAG: M6 family metalloprotease domain-containing protein [Balneolaceae bacterium]
MYSGESAHPTITAGLFTATFLSLLLFLEVSGAPLRNVSQTLTQPDGTILHCFASGDEFHNWLHDADGYTIIQHPETGFYVYAGLDGNTLVPTTLVAGSDDPEAHGLPRNANIPPEEMLKKRQQFEQLTREIQIRELGHAKSAYQQSQFSVLNNILIFIRFSDDPEFDRPLQFYQDQFNKQGTDVLSLYEYYMEASYGQLEIFTTFYPTTTGSTVISYQDSRPRDYYRPKSATNPNGYEGRQEVAERQHELLKNAIAHVENQIPQHINLDNNNDGLVDAISFIVRGAPEGWAELLWPQQWMLFTQDVTVHGIKVWDYTFQMEEAQNSEPVFLGTIAHEMFHVLGAPDLYRYDYSFTPVGPWDLMSTAQDVPPHMNAWMKYLYGGWIDEIPVITQSGSYQLKPLHENSYYRIPSAVCPYEFYVIEYRSASSKFDRALPGEGLLVYRINSRAEGFGNMEAPDEVYLYRPGGTLTLDGNTLEAHYSANSGRTEISGNTPITAFLSDGRPGGLHISNIGTTGPTIGFHVTRDYAPPGTFIKYDGGCKFYGLGPKEPLEVAIRITSAELAGLYGQDLSSVMLYLFQTSGKDVTLKIWEGGTSDTPGQLVHTEYIGDRFTPGTWYVHELNKPVRLQQGNDYWVGYLVNPADMYAVGFDGGPGFRGKSAWQNTEDGWIDLNAVGLDNNLRIRAVITGTGTGTGVLSIADDHVNIPVYPGKTRNVPLRISNTGTGPLTFTATATGGESAVAKTAARPFTATNEVVLILDDGNHMADGFLGYGGENYFYWRNDFQLDQDFDLEKIRFYMTTETQNTNPMEILVVGADGSFVFDTTHVFDLSTGGKWYEYSFPPHARKKMSFKKGQTFSLITGSLNPDIKFPAGYDAEGKKKGFSFYGYYAYLFNQWMFSGWSNLEVFFPKGAWLIRAVGKPGGTTQNQPPVAVAQVTPATAGVNQSVSFSAAGSYDPDGQITAYFWEFGDGQTSNQMNTTHSYSQAGNYTYRLTVTDNQNATGQTTGDISITDTPSRWTINPSTGTIAAGSYRDITISFDSQGLQEGNYQGTVTVNSNAGNKTIPVTITVSRDVRADDWPAVAYTNRLNQNYPNPFNPGTTIRWEMTSGNNVLLEVYDITGRRIGTLTHERYEPGIHETHFDASHLASGVYLYRIQFGDYSAVKPMLLLK